MTTGGNDGSTLFSGNVIGSGDLVKEDTGTMTFSGNNTFNGELEITEGTTSLGADNAFSDAMDLRLNGGTFATDGFADAMDNLIVDSNSTLDFLSASGGFLTFDDATRNGGTLTIDNWVGELGGNGDTRLQVTASSLGGSLIDNITFTGWGDAQLINLGGGLYEVVPDTSGFFEWDSGSGNQNWNSGVNPPWVGNNAPPDNTAGTQVLFGDAIANGSESITLNGDRTVGTMVINATGNRDYSFSADGAPTSFQELRFNSTTGDANLTVLGEAEHFIGRSSGGYTDVVAEDDLNIINNSSGAIGLTLGEIGGDDFLRTGGDSITFRGGGHYRSE